MLIKSESPSAGCKNIYLHKIDLSSYEVLWDKNREIECKKEKIWTVWRLYRYLRKKQEILEGNLSFGKNDWYFQILPWKKKRTHIKVKEHKIEQINEIITSRIGLRYWFKRIDWVNWARFSLSCWWTLIRWGSFLRWGWSV